MKNFARCAAALLLIAAFAVPCAVKSAEKEYRIMVLSDVHFDAKEFNPAPAKDRVGGHRRNYKMWQSRSPELLAAAGRRAAAENAAFAVQLGDLVHGDSDRLGEMLNAGFAVLKKEFPTMPLLSVKGNHDVLTTEKIRDNAASDAALLPIISKELGSEVKGNGCYSFRHGPDLYLAVDGFISAKEIEAFVKKTLADNPDTRYVFFLTHLPLLPCSLRYPFWLLPYHRGVSKMLAKRNTLIIAGHTHVASVAALRSGDRRLTQLVVSSIGKNWTPDRVIPPKYESWESFSQASRKLAKPKGRYNSQEKWKSLDKNDGRTFRQLFGNSGFVILDIDDKRVEARYYTDASDRPKAVLQLLTNDK